MDARSYDGKRDGLPRRAQHDGEALICANGMHHSFA